MVTVEGKHRKMLCLWRVRTDPNLILYSQEEVIVLERGTEDMPGNKMEISFFMVFLFLGLFPLDCFLSSSGSFGGIVDTREQNILKSCFEVRIRMNWLLNTATN